MHWRIAADRRDQSRGWPGALAGVWQINNKTSARVGQAEWALTTRRSARQIDYHHKHHHDMRQQFDARFASGTIAPDEAIYNPSSSSAGLATHDEKIRGRAMYLRRRCQSIGRTMPTAVTTLPRGRPRAPVRRFVPGMHSLDDQPDGREPAADLYGVVSSEPTRRVGVAADKKLASLATCCSASLCTDTSRRRAARNTGPSSV
jgi:hypothetical protein